MWDPNTMILLFLLSVILSQLKLCLGLPWLVKALMSGSSEGDWLVPVQSEGLAYTTISLLLSLILLYTILVASRYGNLMYRIVRLLWFSWQFGRHMWIPPASGSIH